MLTKVKSQRKLRPMPKILNHDKIPPLKGYLTILQVAKIIGRTRQATYSLMKGRRVQMIRIGDVIIIHKNQMARLK